MPPSTSLQNTTGNSDTPKYLVKLTKHQRHTIYQRPEITVTIINALKPSYTFIWFSKKYVAVTFVFSWRYRSSHSELFLRKGVLKICSKFTREHPCWSAISIKLQSKATIEPTGCRFESRCSQLYGICYINWESINDSSVFLEAWLASTLLLFYIAKDK